MATKVGAVAVAGIGAAILLIKLGARKARLKTAEKSLKRASNANAIDESVRGAPDAELDELFRKSQE